MQSGVFTAGVGSSGLCFAEKFASRLLHLKSCRLMLQAMRWSGVGNITAMAIHRVVR
jgi:hypothetical protein